MMVSGTIGYFICAEFKFDFVTYLHVDASRREEQEGV